MKNSTIYETLYEVHEENQTLHPPVEAEEQATARLTEYLRDGLEIEIDSELEKLIALHERACEKAGFLFALNVADALNGDK